MNAFFKSKYLSNKQLCLHSKELEEQEQIKHKVCKRKEIIKPRPHINNIEAKGKYKNKNNEMKWISGSLKRKIDKPLAILTTKEEKIKLNKNRDEKSVTTIDDTEIPRMVRNYFEQLYSIEVSLSSDLDEWTSCQCGSCWGHQSQVGLNAWGLCPSHCCQAVGEFRACVL